MELDCEFIRLPLTFEVSRLADEIRQFGESDWRKHPQGHAGNSALPFVAAGGDPSNDEVRGPMLPTPYLERCPYVQQVLASLQSVIGRTRLMRIEGKGEATPHTDTNYYWMQRVRVHVPIITFPTVEFLCGDTTLNMKAGECWIFDTWRRHNVINGQPEARIHLVCDTVGSAAFWSLVAQGDRPGAAEFLQPAKGKEIRFDSKSKPQLLFEAVNFPVVMSPGEQESFISWLFDQIHPSAAEADLLGLHSEVNRFHWEWRSLWAQYGTMPAGFPSYRALLRQFDAALKQFENKIKILNKSDLAECLRQAIVRSALNPDVVVNPQTRSAKSQAMTLRSPEKETRESTSGSPRRVSQPTAANSISSSHALDDGPDLSMTAFDRPVFIVSAPRSGSSFLFETLSRAPGVYTIGGESHAIIEQIPELSPAIHQWQSNRLTADDASPEITRQLKSNFLSALRDRDEAAPPTKNAVRFLEKTPKNALRIPFLHAAFPDAKFIYLVREAHESISSILEAWRSGRFVTYRELPDWTGPWSLLLIPGWQSLAGKPLNEVAAAQWETANRILLDDLSQLPQEQWTTVSYSDLVSDPQSTIERLCRFADFDWDVDLRHQALPPSRHTLTPPSPNKWQRNSAEIAPVLAGLQGTITRIREVVQKSGNDASEHPAEDSSTDLQRRSPTHSSAAPLESAASPDESMPLRSQHTLSMPQLLGQLNVSLLITTYQAGQLVIARVDDQGKLNTHFRGYQAPMGLAADAGRLAIGAKHHVWTLRNQPDLGRSLDSRVDACYVTRSMHVTGDIRIHEIGWCDEELWIVNTRFSCLCTLDPRYSFVPRWRPKFITAYTPDDRCHLNGLAIVGGRPKYCTALGATDSAGGWRENKPSGGILLDVESNEIMTRGLSMPHSPRLYRNQLWVLNSGRGTLDTIDPKTGRSETVVQLPGFTRGLDFFGDYAFIGLSQVRETAVFSGLPITEQSIDRQSGVWIVDLRTGRTAGFLRFSEKVQEIFAVQVLAGIRFPEIVGDDDRVTGAFVLPEDALQQVPADLKGLRRD